MASLPNTVDSNLLEDGVGRSTAGQKDKAEKGLGEHDVMSVESFLEDCQEAQAVSEERNSERGGSQDLYFPPWRNSTISKSRTSI